MNAPPSNPPEFFPATPSSAPGAPVPGSPAEPPARGLALNFDPWRLVAVLLRRWPWIVVTAIALAAVALVPGYLKFAAAYRASAQLMRQELAPTFRTSEVGEPFKPRQLSVPTLVALMKSPAILQRVATQTELPPATLFTGLTLTPERNTDLITLAFVSTRSPQTAVRVLNAFGNEVVRLTREMQTQEAAEMNRLLQRQLAKADDELRALNREQLEFSQRAGLINPDKEADAYLRTLGDLDLRFESTRIEHETLDLSIAALERELKANNPLKERVQIAREKLAELRQQYTDANPLVHEQRASLSDLEERLKQADTRPPEPPRQGESGLAANFYAELLHLKSQKQVAAAQIEKLKAVRAGVEDKLRRLPEKSLQLARLQARLQAVEGARSLLASRQREAQLFEDAAPGYYGFYEARLAEVEVLSRHKKLLLLALAGGALGALLSAGLLCLVESLDDRIKTAADLQRVSGLPLLAGLPELARLDAAARSGWAYRTWLALRATLHENPAGQVVLGFVAESGGQGCSTWIDLLGRAASQREETVVILTNHPPANAHSQPLAEALARPETVDLSAGRPCWLVAPGDWHWSAAHRAQWQSALALWLDRSATVVLVEISAADHPDTVLFAEGLPQLLWIAGAGSARGRATAERLQTLRHAGCRFIGAALNRETKLFRHP